MQYLGQLTWTVNNSNITRFDATSLFTWTVMEIKPMDLFNSYKSDWNVSDQVQYPLPQLKSYKGKCVTFQRVMKMQLIIGQCFGLNPVLGICETDPYKLRFSYYSWRFFYTVLTIIAQCGLVLLNVMNLIHLDFSIGSNTSMIFASMNCLSTVLFLRIAMQWPRLCVHIARTEVSYPNTDTGLIKRCNVFCFVILVLALVEHMLSDLNGFTLALDCVPDGNLYESFILRTFPWVFAYVSYNPFLGILIQLLNIQFTFNWNFADVFVICVSLYLTSRFEQVNQRILAVKGKNVSSSFWRTMREDYNRVSNLVRVVNDVIGGVVFVSFANNLFFICVQLLHNLADGIKSTIRCQTEGPDIRPFRGYEQPVYFIFSFLFLVVRWLAVSLSAARVHTISKVPAHSLYDVSSNSYCIEVQRFLEQIHGDTVALSGLQFFDVKRGLILSIAGTIITYELVLMQFTGVTPTSPSPI